MRPFQVGITIACFIFNGMLPLRDLFTSYINTGTIAVSHSFSNCAGAGFKSQVLSCDERSILVICSSVADNKYDKGP